jgi:plastocyanin
MAFTRYASGCALAALVSVAACGSKPEPAAANTSAAAAAATSAEVTGVAVRHALVTLLPVGAPIAVPAEPAVMDQRSKQFIPSVLYARVGQPVEFKNSEDMPHNVAVLRRESGAEVFNVGTEANQKYTHTFDRVGQFDVKCDIHEGMEATVIVSKGPLTTIADDSGSFSFPNVAPGSYTVSVTFAGQTVEQPLDVKGPRTSFKFSR